MPRRLLAGLLLAGIVLAGRAPQAQAQATVNVTDTIVAGSPPAAVSGRLEITWDGFTSDDDFQIAAGYKNVDFAAGDIDIEFVPNAGSTPAGTSYRVKYYLPGQSFTETWVIPGGPGPYTILQVKVSEPPTPLTTLNASQITGLLPEAHGGTGLAPATAGAITARSIQVMAGCDACPELTDADDQANVWRNNIGAVRITEVWCQTDAGESVINLQRDDGTPANLLSANLTCTTAGAIGAIDLAEDDLAAGNKLDFVMVTAAASGAPKRVSVNMKALIQ
jgi:hypothetical protein